MGLGVGARACLSGCLSQVALIVVFVAQAVAAVCLTEPLMLLNPHVTCALMHLSLAGPVPSSSVPSALSAPRPTQALALSCLWGGMQHIMQTHGSCRADTGIAFLH